ncbi:helix-turn-helix domain-containing protein [Rhizobiales bacterium]|uniref:GlxA family transcriptional regulator n=1 Tax=Hongsoonwoonella zoysiae TaxID=2821844 RepID=UPI0015617B05|nr:helix-turn-helix domain-containing protein [Hongsoonwoonella zoysiae]NRG18081.1 helix-turn-helix domain-containing protein [Hongsoonwoonella zoysiae]
MAQKQDGDIETLILALPETAGSALYGMIDVLAAAGRLWQEMVGTEMSGKSFRTRIVSLRKNTFRCGNGIPVHPDVIVRDDPPCDILILPELWLAMDEDLSGRYPQLVDWIRAKYRAGAHLYSACSGSVLLAATGLLDGREATSHWAYADLFRTQYPKVRFQAEPNLVFADPAGRIVTAGGASSWHDLALHIIARHLDPEEALRIAKVYLLKWHGEGQLPYASLVRYRPHADSVVRKVQDWLAENFTEPSAVTQAVLHSGIPERSLKRRFGSATGSTLIAYVQNLRIEEAKRVLEREDCPCEDVAARVGYENPAFFRRLFKRSTGLTPAQYRRMFRPLSQGRHAELAE